jgi:hypothetical protein
MHGTSLRYFGTFLEPYSFVDTHTTRIGFGLGAVIASVMMSVVRGGVNTLIVCFADSPARLQENHPELTLELLDAWAKAFPATIQKSSYVPLPTAEPVDTITESIAYP